MPLPYRVHRTIPIRMPLPVSVCWRNRVLMSGPVPTATDEDGAPLDVILIPGACGAAEASEYPTSHAFFLFGCVSTLGLGVAFDRSLARLGHGKGYYDRFLTSYTSLASARGTAKPLFGEQSQRHPDFVADLSWLSFKVGLALREQVLAAGEVPVGANDVRVDMVVTPDETITLHHI